MAETGEVYIYKEPGYVPKFEPVAELGRHARNLQYARVLVGERQEPVTIVNVHGLWNGQGKTDTDERISQSQRIVDFLKTVETKVIICGDFNLRLDTKSVEMIEAVGLRNLIREHGVLSTRTSLYSKEEKHADYIFVSPEVTVQQFQVMPDEVSDHAPLLLEFE